MIGYIKNWNPERGFGFLSRQDHGPDVFVHVSDFFNAWLTDLRIGDELSFEMLGSRDGRARAGGLKLLGEGSGDFFGIEARRKQA